MKAPAKTVGPFAMKLDVELLDRLTEPVRSGRAPSVSAIIRDALERLDLSRVVVLHAAQLIISVRLPAAKRQELRRAALRMNTSIGQLVRIAVDAYLPTLESGSEAQMEIPIAEPATADPVPPAAPVAEAPAVKPRPPRESKPPAKVPARKSKKSTVRRKKAAPATARAKRPPRR